MSEQATEAFQRLCMTHRRCSDSDNLARLNRHRDHVLEALAVVYAPQTDPDRQYNRQSLVYGFLMGRGITRREAELLAVMLDALPSVNPAQRV